MAGIDHFYLLGAGFSRPATIPLCDELLPLVYQAASRDRFGDGSSTLEILLDSLRLYYPTVDFSLQDGRGLEQINVEEFISYLTVTSACERDTGNEFDEHGNRELSFFKRWLAQTIYSHQQQAIDKLPEYYHDFARMIGGIGDALIFTFNWDTILEHVMDFNGIDYNFDSRHHLTQGVPSIHKLHGSIDWFSKSKCSEYPDVKAVAGSMPSLARVPFKHLPALFDDHICPWIICPSFDKVHQISTLQALWQMLYLFFQNTGDLVVIGYSMRPDDFHSYAMIYPQLVQASKNQGLRIKVIDFAETEEDKEKVRERYRGVPEENISFFFDGWSDSALDFIAS